MTRQEMFNLAVQGLRSQGFERCVAERGSACVYLDPLTGRRCAWGWVDRALTDEAGDIETLYTALVQEDSKYGMPPAASLIHTMHPEDILWAKRLQSCHDEAGNAAEVEARLKSFAIDGGLEWPA